MAFRPEKAGQSTEEAARTVQISEYRKRNEQLERASDGLALRSFKEHPDSVQEETKRLAYEAMNNLFERIRILAELHGGTAQRLDSYPKDLPLPEDKHINLQPNEVLEQNKWIKEGDQMFARLDAKGRTYVFFIPESGGVNVYKDGEYVGGNHDLALFEIHDNLERDDWFGVNAG